MEGQGHEPEGVTMKTASELFKEFLPSAHTPRRTASLFAADEPIGLLEWLPVANGGW